MKLNILLASLATAILVSITVFGYSNTNNEAIAQKTPSSFTSTVQNVNAGVDGNSYQGSFIISGKATRTIFSSADLKANTLVPKDIEISIKNDSSEVLTLTLVNVHANTINDIPVNNLSSVVLSYSNVEKIDITNTGSKSAAGSYIVTIK